MSGSALKAIAANRYDFGTIATAAVDAEQRQVFTEGNVATALFSQGGDMSTHFCFYMCSGATFFGGKDTKPLNWVREAH